MELYEAMAESVGKTSSWYTVLEFIGAILSGPAGCSDPSVLDKKNTAADVSQVVPTDSYIPPCPNNLLPQEMGLKINEILPNPKTSDNGLEWIELFNKSNEVTNLEGYTLLNRQNSIVATLPKWSLPPCTYIVIHFGHGTNNANFLNGAAHLFTGSDLEALNDFQDEITLYNGASPSSKIVDFVAYSRPEIFSAGEPLNLAVAANQWSAGDFVNIAGIVSLGNGDSLGRDINSTDTNSSADWGPLGGLNSITPTRGTINSVPTPKQEGATQVKLRFVEHIAPQQTARNWTLLIYMAADNSAENSLQGLGYIDLNKMELANPQNVYVAAMVDFNTKVGEITSPAYVWLRHDDNTADDMRKKYLKTSLAVRIPEPNTGNPQALRDFVNWGMQTFPVNPDGHYYLVIYGHGGNWKGIASDASSGNDRLAMEELRQALSGISPRLGVITFMSCMMAGVEVANQMRESAEYMVASEEVVTLFADRTWPWDQIINMLNSVPAPTPRQAAIETVNLVSAVFTASNPYHTLSAINLNGENFDNLISNLAGFSLSFRKGLGDWGMGFTVNDNPQDNVQVVLREMLKNEKDVINAFPIEHKSPFSGGDQGPDLVDLTNLVTKINASDKIAPPFKKEAGNILNNLGAVVVNKINGTIHANAGGLSIYFPQARTPNEHKSLGTAKPSSFEKPIPKDEKQILYGADDDYTAKTHPVSIAGLTFLNAVPWEKVLHRYYNPVANISCNGFSSCQAAPGETVTFRATGSSDSDGELTKYCWDFHLNKNTDNGDFDKDGMDGPDDDCEEKYKNEQKVEFTCPNPGEDAVFPVRLMVWDDHHKAPGHSKHFQVDSAQSGVKCVNPR